MKILFIGLTSEVDVMAGCGTKHTHYTRTRTITMMPTK